MNDDASDLIRLDLYPIGDRANPRRAALVERFKADLDARQVCVLSDFITKEARQRMIGDALAILPKAYRNRSHRTCFLNRNGDPSVNENHPRNTFFDASYRMMAYDLFDADMALPRFYRWPAIRELVADVVGAQRLFLNEDPYQPANVVAYGDGDQSTWHFDRGNDFTVTLMLQAPEAGGVFELAPEVLDDDDPDMRRLADVLQGRSRDVISVDRVPGALVIFRGDRSAHRVSPVKGDTLRLMCVMVYEPKPGVVGRPEVNATVYGPRTSQARA
ncbi:MAG: 2OG-Fe(II) oxygenase [Alphaproteobacteria bacterium]|nr:2OG-Fe(II) oxygenase [Alphaproteobacteria bacterium]